MVNPLVGATIHWTVAFFRLALPFAPWAVLRTFKIVPDNFVEPPDQGRRFETPPQADDIKGLHEVDP